MLRWTSCAECPEVPPDLQEVGRDNECLDPRIWWWWWWSDDDGGGGDDGDDDDGGDDEVGRDDQSPLTIYEFCNAPRDTSLQASNVHKFEISTHLIKYWRGWSEELQTNTPTLQPTKQTNTKTQSKIFHMLERIHFPRHIVAPFTSY